MKQYFEFRREGGDLHGVFINTENVSVIHLVSTASGGRSERGVEIWIPSNPKPLSLPFGIADDNAKVWEELRSILSDINE